MGTAAGRKGGHLVQSPSAPLNFHCWLHTLQPPEGFPHLEGSVFQWIGKVAQTLLLLCPLDSSVLLDLGMPNLWDICCPTATSSSVAKGQSPALSSC